LVNFLAIFVVYQFAAKNVGLTTLLEFFHQFCDTFVVIVYVVCTRDNIFVVILSALGVNDRDGILIVNIGKFITKAT
jgi:hypothetical protein